MLFPKYLFICVSKIIHCSNEIREEGKLFKGRRNSISKDTSKDYFKWWNNWYEIIGTVIYTFDTMYRMVNCKYKGIIMCNLQAIYNDHLAAVLD